MKKRSRIKFIFAWHYFWVGFFWDQKDFAIYIFPVPMFGFRITIWGRRCYVVRKRGMFYRPGDCGYTDHISLAGRYTHAEAKDREYPHDERVTMHHVSEFI